MNPGPRPVGRHLRQGNGWIFGWPGTGLDLRFRGRGLKARVAGSIAWVEVVANGTSRALEIGANGDTVDLVESQPLQEWTVRIRKRTEGSVGELHLRDLQVMEGTWMEPPPAPARRIEFLGDSITCAYGCLEPDPLKGFDPATEDFGRSWAKVAGDLLDGEVHAQAWSGIGVVRNWPGVDRPPLPRFWKRAVPTRPGDWDLSSWMPHLVVVNLCSNDYGVLPFLADREFVEGAVAWLRDVRAHRPHAPVVVVDGPLLKNDHPRSGTLDLVRSLLDQATEAMGGIPAGFHRLSLATVSGPETLGADFHPSAVHQRANGQELASFVRSRGLL
ncbi:MAG TPA: GDSL-type esterase/lipase family protein [Fibrobacteria bacterium]|nr:GDSL-type esterase/lipase family protein [Fibrobacteria bacterium]HOX51709.1 GDSL-type esterase/lipase family protein [Fibrobacteria bacterium]